MKLILCVLWVAVVLSACKEDVPDSYKRSDIAPVTPDAFNLKAKPKDAAAGSVSAVAKDEKPGVYDHLNLKPLTHDQFNLSGKPAQKAAESRNGGK